MKPNFLGIGAAKSGTTTIARVLNRHPEIFMSIPKELHFFDADEFDESEDSLNEYFNNFEENLIVGEFTPSYMFVPDASVRIKEHLGTDIKFLAILRNPTYRAYSHYCHAVKNWKGEEYARRGYPVEDLSFREAIEQEPERLASGIYHIRHQSYYSKGLYAVQLKRYYDIFHDENIKVVLLEDYIADPELVLKEIYNFLKVDFGLAPPLNNIKLNSQSDGNLSDSDRRWLGRRFLDSINELEVLLGRNLDVWKH